MKREADELWQQKEPFQCVLLIINLLLEEAFENNRGACCWFGRKPPTTRESVCSKMPKVTRESHIGS